MSEIVPLGARSVTDTKENQTQRCPTTLTVCGCGETVSWVFVEAAPANLTRPNGGARGEAATPGVGGASGLGPAQLLCVSSVSSSHPLGWPGTAWNN